MLKKGVMALLELIILFLVIFDPPASFFVFMTLTAELSKKERLHTARNSILLAFILSICVLLFGNHIFQLFSTTIDEFRIAGGIILGLLGIKMVMGQPLTNMEKIKSKGESWAIASVIATPMLTGPAAITAIIIAATDYGKILTGVAILIVFAITSIIFIIGHRMVKLFGNTGIQIMTTILGLITLSWGVKFIHLGLRNLFF